MGQINAEIMLWILGGFAVAISYIFLVLFQDRTRITMTEKMVEVANHDLKESVERLESDMKAGFQEIKTKMDIFFADENKLMKGMIDQLLKK